MFRAAAVVRKERVVGNSFLLMYSHYFNLLRLIAAAAQDIPRIQRLLLLDPSLVALVELRNGRFFDTGLEMAFGELLIRGSGRCDPPVRPNPISVIKERLPNVRIGTPHLRLCASDAPCFDAVGKTRVAADYWSKVWARRVSAPDRAACSLYLDSYNKKVDLSLISIPSLDDIKSGLQKTGNTAALALCSMACAA